MVHDQLQSLCCWTEIGELWSTINKVLLSHFNLPQVDTAHCTYANAFEFGPNDFAGRGISTLPLHFLAIGLTVPGVLTLDFAPNF